MPTLSIRLSEPLKSYVDDRVASGDYDDASELVSQLLKAERKRRAEATLVKLVDEAEASGPPVAWTDDDWEKIDEEIAAGVAKRKQHRKKKHKQAS
jgi:antitoxin ParD1/3/4